jgi:hypothetical protein
MVPGRIASALLLVGVLGLDVACARERVEVGESDAGGASAAEVDGEAPIFPGGDGGADVILSTCGPPPAIGRCNPPCPNGYVTLEDGGATCECCP